MQPNYIPQGPALELDWSDRKAIQKLYGKAVLGEMILGADRGHWGSSEHNRTPFTPHWEAGPQRAPNSAV